MVKPGLFQLQLSPCPTPLCSYEAGSRQGCHPCTVVTEASWPKQATPTPFRMKSLAAAPSCPEALGLGKLQASWGSARTPLEGPARAMAAGQGCPAATAHLGGPVWHGEGAVLACGPEEMLSKWLWAHSSHKCHLARSWGHSHGHKLLPGLRSERKRAVVAAEWVPPLQLGDE